jgi:integrase
MGPILSDAEINEIDYIIAYKSTLKNQLKLSLIKKWYDKAITDDIDYNKLRNKYNLISERDIKDKYNRKYVDKLVAVKFYL